MLGVALEFKDFPNTTTPLNATNLNNMQKLLVDLIYPVGTYYETSDTNFNPNDSWGGTWSLETDGTVLVSKSNTTGSKFNDVIGTIVGEETHTLTIDEMPAHNHDIYVDKNTGLTGQNNFYPLNFIQVASNYVDKNVCSTSGGNQPHNNVQPSKIVNRWHRTA